MIDINQDLLDVTALSVRYLNNTPFPHIVLDDFLPTAVAEQLEQDFPDYVDHNQWIHYHHFNENKLGLNNKAAIPASLLEIIRQLNSQQFLNFLEGLTGIKKLIADETLEGGGLHVSRRGGYLNIHTDFETHPKDLHLLRRINVLLYLNKNWPTSYNGDLEFWSKDMQQCEAKISPIFNRLVVFNTTNISFHGFPDKINCPDTAFRKSIALYYYIRTDSANPIKTTKYQLKPGEKSKIIPNWLDNTLILIYTYLKRKLNISDVAMSKFLHWKNRFKL